MFFPFKQIIIYTLQVKTFCKMLAIFQHFISVSDTTSGLDLAIFRVLRVRQNSVLNK